jgi:hypothetical protein
LATIICTSDDLVLTHINDDAWLTGAIAAPTAAGSAKHDPEKWEPVSCSNKKMRS